MKNLNSSFHYIQLQQHEITIATYDIIIATDEITAATDDVIHLIATCTTLVAMEL